MYQFTKQVKRTYGVTLRVGGGLMIARGKGSCWVLAVFGFVMWVLVPGVLPVCKSF